eukprot:gene9529-9692_t
MHKFFAASASVSDTMCPDAPDNPNCAVCLFPEFSTLISATFALLYLLVFITLRGVTVVNIDPYSLDFVALWLANVVVASGLILVVSAILVWVPVYDGRLAGARIGTPLQGPVLLDAPTELLPLVGYGKLSYSHDAASSEFEFSNFGDDLAGGDSSFHNVTSALLAVEIVPDAVYLGCFKMTKARLPDGPLPKLTNWPGELNSQPPTLDNKFCLDRIFSVSAGAGSDWQCER